MTKLKIDLNKGILENAEFIPSPNCDDRPKQCEINLLVIHNISLPPGKFGGPYINQLFSNTLDPDDDPFFKEINHLRVSSHLLIRRDGHIIQYVPFHKRAWHAGVSEYDGQDCCNDFSIGIELEGTDMDEYEELQYQTLANITKLLLNTYTTLSSERITGHCHIAPDRKTDPGDSFDWEKYKELIS